MGYFFLFSLMQGMGTIRGLDMTAVTALHAIAGYFIDTAHIPILVQHTTVGYDSHCTHHANTGKIDTQMKVENFCYGKFFVQQNALVRETGLISL